MNYQSNSRNVIAYLQQNQIDLAIISRASDIAYLTGIFTSESGREAMLYLTKTDSYLLHSPLLVVEPTKEFVSLAAKDTSVKSKLIEKFVTAGIKRIGYQQDDLSLNEGKGFHAMLSGKEFIDISDCTSSFRAIKSKKSYLPLLNPPGLRLQLCTGLFSN